MIGTIAMVLSRWRIGRRPPARPCPACDVHQDDGRTPGAAGRAGRRCPTGPAPGSGPGRPGCLQGQQVARLVVHQHGCSPCHPPALVAPLAPRTLTPGPSPPSGGEGRKRGVCLAPLAHVLGGEGRCPCPPRRPYSWVEGPGVRGPGREQLLTPGAAPAGRSFRLSGPATPATGTAAGGGSTGWRVVRGAGVQALLPVLLHGLAVRATIRQGAERPPPSRRNRPRWSRKPSIRAS